MNVNLNLGANTIRNKYIEALLIKKRYCYGQCLPSKALSHCLANFDLVVVLSH